MKDNARYVADADRCLIQILVIAVLLPLIYWGNPAVALLIGAALSLGLNRQLLPQAEKWHAVALQTAIVLLGLKLNTAQLLEIGANYSLLVSVFVVATIALGMLVGRVVGNDRNSTLLIASGTAICGGTTIASLSPVIKARGEQTAVALTLVFLLNAVALFVFPIIGDQLELSQNQFGVWAALAIHDTSSVVATSAIYGDEAAVVATTVKLGRTLWLIPLLIGVSLVRNRQGTKVSLPLFVVFFIAAALLSSVIAIPAEVTRAAGFISKALLVVALYFIGTGITRSTVMALRGAPVWHGLVLWAAVVPAVLFFVVRTV